MFETILCATFSGTKDILYRNMHLPYETCTPKQKKVFLLGSGWFSKGFIENIDLQRFKITNISNKPYEPTDVPFCCPKIKFPCYSNDIETIEETVLDINLETNTIATTNDTYDFSDNYLVCGLGSNRTQSIWNKQIEQLFNHVPDKINIIGAGITGTELAFVLSDIGYKVTLFDTIDPYSLMFEQIRICIEQRQRDTLIKLHKNTPFMKDDKCDIEQNVFNAVNVNQNKLTFDWSADKYLNVSKLIKRKDGSTYTNLFTKVFIGGDCIKVGNSTMHLSRTAQDAYEQGKYVAQTLNEQTREPYVQTAKFRTLYVGDNKTMLYHDTINMFILVPTSIVEWYHSLW
jgi:NADH dehydrogenase FAD-containing subunit